MSSESSCCCNSRLTLIFACSGASDVGEITDLAARHLMKHGAGKMFCLAGIGGRVSGILKTTEAAERILAIDGCPLACARQTLEQAGIRSFNHVQLADLGMAKSESPATEDRITQAVNAGLNALGNLGSQR